MTEEYPQVLSFGEVLWDLLPSGMVIGGAAANLAFRLHELDNNVALVSRLGTDALGTQLREGLKSKGFNLSFIQEDHKKPTGTVPVAIDSEGKASYNIIPDVAFDYIELTPQLSEAASHCSAISFGTLIQRSEVSRNTLYECLEIARGALKVCDINLRKDCYSAHTVEKSMEKADVLNLNNEETLIVSQLLGMKSKTFEQFAFEAIEKFGLELVLVTCGSEGNWAFTPAGTELHVRGYRVPVTDTVGAGDNFTAAFLHRRLQRDDLENCCLFGNKIGALVASKEGGMPKITAQEMRSIDNFERSGAILD